MATPARSRRHLSSSPFKPPVEEPVVIYEIGERVTHDTYGLGRIIGLENGIAVSIDFGSFTKRINLPSKKLFPL
ncbi:MAG: hypothetical protein H7288_15325 [Kineosporiaceae bacterium]|nr:hypothetical protein [Aeromicrobium sp.]